MARTAIVTFEGEADRRIAGIPWAARVARELADAGYERLVLPPLRAETLDEIARVAPGVSVEESDEGDAIIVSPPSEAEILRRTGKPTDGPISRLFNRPVSQLISRMLLRFPGVRPVHVTLAAAALALAMFWALIAGGATGLVVAGLLFHAASVVDGVDGEIARATFRATRSGAILDSSVDVATTLLFIVGLTVHLAARGDALVLPMAAWGISLFLLGLLVICWQGARRTGPFNFNYLKRHYRERVTGRWMPKVIAALTIYTSRDFYALYFAILILVGLPLAVIGIFALAASIWILFVIGSIGFGPAPDAAYAER